MSAIRTIRNQFWRSAGLLTGMSAVILLMPWAAAMADRTGDWSIRGAGILFWLFAISGYGTVMIANKNRLKFLNNKFGRDIQNNFRPGILCFFSNGYAKTADIMLAALFAAFAVSLFTHLKNTYFIVAVLALFVWAANMHCLFNGRIYRITKYDSKERGKYE